MIKEPSLSDLRLFVCVVEHSSFINAAKQLGLAQATVSKRIAVLEESLGVKLLLRTTRSVKVTDDGMKTYQRALRIAETVSDLRDELSSSQGELAGPIRISASARLGRDYVAPALSKLKVDYPDVEVWLEIMDRRVDLMTEDFHLDVRSGNAEEPNVIGHFLAPASRIMCASPAYVQQYGSPRTMQDLTQHACLLLRERNEPFGSWSMCNEGGYTDVRINAALASNDNDVILAWAKDGRGIMNAADWFVAPALASGELQRVLAQWEQPVGVWAVSTQRTGQSRKLHLVMEYLKAEFSGLENST